MNGNAASAWDFCRGLFEVVVDGPPPVLRAQPEGHGSCQEPGEITVSERERMGRSRSRGARSSDRRKVPDLAIPVW